MGNLDEAEAEEKDEDYRFETSSVLDRHECVEVPSGLLEDRQALSRTTLTWSAKCMSKGRRGPF